MATYNNIFSDDSKTTLTLGSLFDGSGGFPLGGMLCGITPVWASEIEPFHIRVYLFLAYTLYSPALCVM